MSDSDEVLAYLHAAKARVDGGGTAPTRGDDAVRYARARLEEALPHAHAGAHLPDDARLRPVKQAVLGAVRPVTSHQEPFNRAVLQALDGVAEALDGVLHRADVHEQQAARLQAGVATSELAIDDLADDVRALRHEVSDLAVQVATLHGAVEAARSEAAAYRQEREAAARRQLKLQLEAAELRALEAFEAAKAQGGRRLTGAIAAARSCLPGLPGVAGKPGGGLVRLNMATPEARP